MGRKSQAKHSGKDKPDKDKLRKARQLSVLCEKILTLTSVLPGAEGGTNSWDLHLAVGRLLDEVAVLEGSEGRRRARSDGLVAFTKWLQENGAEFEGVEVAEFVGYELGLRATKVFKTDSMLVAIPRQIMLSEVDAHKSVIGGFIGSDPLLKTMPNVALALFLLLEKCNADSFWKPYLDILPESYSSVLYFTKEELQELKPSPVLERALKLCRSVARQYAYLHGKIHAGTPGARLLRDVFTYQRYRWAVSTAMTRQNSVQGSTAFIPLWDMCNHEHGRISTGYNDELCRSECFAHRDFQPGEQIRIFYGVRSNADLFLHNGFVYPENQQDTTTISLGISSSDSLREKRLALLAKLGLAGVTQFALHGNWEGSERTPLSPELLAFIRVFSMNEEELTKFLADDFAELVSDELSSVTIVGPSLERRAYQYLQTRCRLVAATYVKFAPKITEGEEESINRRNIRLLKESELRILENTIQHTQKVLDQLPNEETSTW